MGDQTDITLFLPGLEIGKIATVQGFQDLRVAMILANAVQ